MELKIFKGTSLLDTTGFYQGGRVYIPGEALDTFVGLWKGDMVFLNSPLAGKRICVTVLSPSTFVKGLPPSLEHFLALCSAAGAHLTYHDGGKFPASDLILVIEPGGTHTYINYLGAAFRSKPLAGKITANIKRGLRLTYLPDPVPFHKRQYNLKLSLGARLCTPAVAIQWPDSMVNLGAWLFTSLMEHFGHGMEMDGTMLSLAKLEPDHETSNSVLVNDRKPILQEPTQKELPTSPVQAPPPAKPTQSQGGGIRTNEKSGAGYSASMSRAQYPDYFAQLDKSKKAIKKEPFT